MFGHVRLPNLTSICFAAEETTTATSEEQVPAEEEATETTTTEEEVTEDEVTEKPCSDADQPALTADETTEEEGAKGEEPVDGESLQEMVVEDSIEGGQPEGEMEEMATENQSGSVKSAQFKHVFPIPPHRERISSRIWPNMLASYPGLLHPVFVACGTSVGEGLVN